MDHVRVILCLPLSHRIGESPLNGTQRLISQPHSLSLWASPSPSPRPHLPPWICSHNPKHVRLIYSSVLFLECPSLFPRLDKDDLASTAYKYPHLRRLSETHAQIIALLFTDTRSYWIVCGPEICPYSNPSPKDIADGEPLAFAPLFFCSS